jgi:hypothetical protein
MNRVRSRKSISSWLLARSSVPIDRSGSPSFRRSVLVDTNISTSTDLPNHSITPSQRNAFSLSPSATLTKIFGSHTLYPAAAARCIGIKTDALKPVSTSDNCESERPTTFSRMSGRPRSSTCPCMISVSKNWYPYPCAPTPRLAELRNKQFSGTRQSRRNNMPPVVYVEYDV